MGKRQSINLSDKSLAFIAARHRGDAEDYTWSASVNGAISVLDGVLRRNIPELSNAAWRLLLNAYNAHAPTPGVIDDRLAGAVMDDLGIVDISTCDDDTRAAINEIAALTQIQCMAAYDLCVRFWCKDWADSDANTLHEQIQSLR